MESHLALKDVKVEIGNKTILDVDTFELPKGKIMGLVGENGAGKSTLLSVLALIEKPSSGRVFHENKQIFQSLLIRKHISLVFQKALLFKGSVISNIAYPLKLRKLSKAQINKRCTDILKQFKIEHLAGQDARTLSGGEEKKVSLARALVYDPSVLLLDEPFRDLDSKVRTDIENTLFALVKKKKISTVFVSHDFEDIAKHCSHITIIEKGRLVQQGKIDEVLASPADKQVASILGDTSFIEAKVKKVTGGTIIVKAGSYDFEVSANDSKSIKVGAKMFVNLRPEDIFISNNGSFNNSSVRNSFEAKVVAIEKNKSHSRLRLDCGFIADAAITKQSVEELEIFEGKTVVAGFKATAAKIIRSNIDY